MSFPLSSDARQQIQEALGRGSKIEAIKIYREATSTGLAEAKHAVEQMEAELRVQAPMPYMDVPPQVAPPVLGCTLIIVAFAVVALAVLFFVKGAGADNAAEGRYTLALMIVFSLFVVLQGCIASFNPKRLVMAYALIGIGLVIAAMNVWRVLSH
jgi:hypothetical protein